MSWVDRKLVLVEWTDACVSNSWDNGDITQKLGQCWSVGILWNDNTEMLTIVGTVSDAGDINQVINIPRPNVTSIQEVNHVDEVHRQAPLQSE